MKRFQLLFLKLLPYLTGSALLIALMVFGSNVKVEDASSPIASNFSDVNFRVTADQVSESYVVASIADTLELPSASTSGENFVTISNHYDETGTISTQTNTINDKPTVIDTSNLSRGIISYTVKDGDTLASIADAYGVSKDHIRWSNDMKEEDVEEGDTLLIPSVDGIVYKVKDGDTIEDLADKYGSNKDEIIAYNDLEVDNDLEEDTRIILPGGDLPEKERPEYEPPAPAPTVISTPTYYAYSTNSGTRKNMIEIGSYGYWASVYNYRDNTGVMDPGAFGNCTWFAWYWRNHAVDTGALPESYRLPGGTVGNARDWAWSFGSRGFTVNQTPAYGAIMQSMSGYYGHVAVVVDVDYGNSITIQEMNYAGPNGMFNHVYQSTIDWGDAMGFNYIHGR